MPVIPATQEAKIEGIAVHVQSRKKVRETPSFQQTSWAWWYTPIITAAPEA
jgi:hypothetical protein